MKIHEFGRKDMPVVVMIHGEFMSWDMLGGAIKLLAERFHVLAVGVPGHDTSSKDSFTSVENIAARVELTLVQFGAAKIDLLYGLSMGGAIAVRMLADAQLHIRHAVIDGGTCPYDVPWVVSRLMLSKDGAAAKKLRNDVAALETAYPPERYGDSFTDGVYNVLREMTDEEAERIAVSMRDYPMPSKFPKIGTWIEYWYGSDEEDERRADAEYMRKHVPNTTLRRIDGMAHGQYVVSCPESFANDITAIIEKHRKSPFAD